MLVKRGFGDSRYPHRPTLDILGLIGDCEAMSHNLGILPYFCQPPTSPRKALTIEFLSTLRCLSNRPKPDSSFTFRLGNREHTLTPDTLNALMGFKRGGKTDDKLTTAEANKFWKEITGKPVYSSDDRASIIVNPSIRFMHRVISSILFPRGDSAGKVSTRDLLYLKAALYPEFPTPDLGFHMLKFLLKTSIAPTGPICVGNIITRLAVRLNVPYLHYMSICNDPMDIPYLIGCKFLWPFDDNNPAYYLRYHQQDHTVDDQRRWELPDPEHTSIVFRANWFDTLKDGQQNTEQPDASDAPGPSTSRRRSRRNK